MMTTTVSESGMVTSVNGGWLTYLAAIFIGVLVSAAVAALVAWYSFSTRGSSHFYIAIVSLALSAAVQTAYIQFPPITGGENGLFGFALPNVSQTAWYYVAAIVLAAVIACALVFVRSDFGLLLIAIRDQERRASYLGYDVNLVKILVFALGAALAAFAGGLYAMIFGLVSAPLFGFLFATEILVWVAIGGRGTIIGPALGAIAINLIGPQLNQQFPFQWQLLLGALFVAVVVLLPEGIIAPLGRVLRRVFGGSEGSVSNLSIQSAPNAEAQVAHAPLTANALTFRNVEFAYGALKVLRGIDLEIHQGELLCIVGPNGAGKSTLLNILTDGRMGHTGEIDLTLTQSVKQKGAAPFRLVRAGLGRKFQTPALFPALTAAETMILATRRGKLPSIRSRSQSVEVPVSVLRLFDVAGLQEHLHRPARELAHGVKQGLDLATAIANKPEVLLLDEPTAGLTTAEREKIGEVIQHLVRDAGVTVILIEHDLDFVLRIADRIAVLHDGRVIECGPPDTVAQSQV
ncbi:MAG: ATP-binding cassette domain-containing protein, partial [Acidobacteria bacterium]|nr:ATP-binding cassette domain-containing protein [Acidobacteriota bacterium]